MSAKPILDNGFALQVEAQEKAKAKADRSKDNIGVVRISVAYEVEVRDKDGKLLSFERGEAHSFVRNWIRMLRTIFSAGRTLGNVTVSLTDTLDTARTYYGASSSGLALVTGGCNAGGGEHEFGTQIGTSTTAFDRAQTRLQAKIAHGTGSGQMLYGAMTVEDYSETDTQARFRLTRAFTNNSGASITVNEIGVYIANYYAGDVVRYFMVCRDVLASPQSVPDGASLTVRYILYITY